MVRLNHSFAMKLLVVTKSVKRNLKRKDFFLQLMAVLFIGIDTLNWRPVLSVNIQDHAIFRSIYEIITCILNFTKFNARQLIFFYNLKHIGTKQSI